MFKFITGLVCVFFVGVIYYFYKTGGNTKMTPDFYGEKSVWDELKNTSEVWLPVIVLIIIITCIIIAMALVSATEANVYYNGGLI